MYTVDHTKLEIEKNVLMQINVYRNQNNLSNLKFNDLATTLAQYHSEKMANEKKLSHDGFEDRQKKLHEHVSGSYIYRWATENVAMCKPTIANVVNMWKGSPGHNKNMLSNANYCGIGYCSNKDNEHYFTAIFVKFDH